MKTMDRSKAWKMDTNFVADFCDETNDYGVFGTGSGFCYSTWSDEDTAERKAAELCKQRNG